MTAFTHREGRVLNVEGAQLYYEELGRERNQVLVLLHGGLGTLEDFNPLVPALADSFRLVALDSRGHGRSTLGRGTLTYARLEADVRALLQHLEIDRCALLGFSDGGIVGLRLAASAPDQFDKLAVLGTTYQLRETDPLRERLRGVTPESWQAKFPETAATYERLNPEPDFAALVRAAVSMWIDLSESGHPGARIQNIRCPVLVGRGDDDPLVTRSVAFELAEHLPQAALCNLPFAAHEVHKDQAGIVGQLLARFLA